MCSTKAVLNHLCCIRFLFCLYLDEQMNWTFAMLKHLRNIFHILTSENPIASKTLDLKHLYKEQTPLTNWKLVKLPLIYDFQLRLVLEGWKFYKWVVLMRYTSGKNFTLIGRTKPDFPVNQELFSIFSRIDIIHGEPKVLVDGKDMVLERWKLDMLYILIGCNQVLRSTSLIATENH